MVGQVYEPDTRSEIEINQKMASLELKDKTGASVDLYFGPTSPTAHEDAWIKTNPCKR